MSKIKLGYFLIVPLFYYAASGTGKIVNDNAYKNNQITLEQYLESDAEMNKLSIQGTISSCIIGLMALYTNKKK